MMVGCKQLQVWLEPSSQGRHQPIDRNGGSAAAQTVGTQAVAADPAAEFDVDVDVVGKELDLFQHIHVIANNLNFSKFWRHKLVTRAWSSIFNLVVELPLALSCFQPWMCLSLHCMPWYVAVVCICIMLMHCRRVLGESLSGNVCVFWQ